MSDILILNGPNLNLLGTRENNIYGTQTLKQIEENCKKITPLDFFQSNSESEIINKIQNFTGTAIIINAAAFTHTSIAILDALNFLRGINQSLIIMEVHLSNIHKREDFRHKSYISKIADGVICGLGAQGYYSALNYIINAQTQTNT